MKNNKVSWFDQLLYRVFFWRWQRIFANRADLRELFIAYLKAFDVIDEGTKVTITITKTESKGKDDELNNEMDFFG